MAIGFFKQLNHQVSAMLNWIETPAGPLPPPAAAVSLRRRIPHALLRHAVVEISAYQEGGMVPLRQVQPARLEIPWIISFGEPFFVKMGKAIQACTTPGSFVAGLVAGPAVIDSQGKSSCITVSFTPTGARRFFALPLHEMTGCMVTQEDLLGNTGAALREQLNSEADWERRFDMVEHFLARRLHRTEGRDAATAWAFERLRQSQGRGKIEAIAREIGWSRKHLAVKFRDEIGLTPKTVAQMVRFHCVLAQARHRAGSWADLASACGYADQVHMVRDFTRFTGESPTTWWKRLAP
ncbi:helix-turn-helix domain-containing protein [Comamonas sp. GB3 AK4-5]|uniref:helix-turn-helix domain-containing protein n=1 Tax=Comamonas sp. GB3 AK4-5 TaxID=3231487 RepID=UPI00351E378A